MKVSANRIDMQRARIDQAQLKDFAFTKTAPAISAGTLTLDISTGNVFEVSLNANVTTLSITNPAPSGTACNFTLVSTGDGTPRTITWPSSVQWAGGGAAPTLSNTKGKKDFFSFYTSNAGTTWFGTILGQGIIAATASLWTWGAGAAGRLGLGNVTDYSSPKQVGAQTTWQSIAAGRLHTIALKTDGTLWTWGQNVVFGNLGLGDVTNRSSPVQVGALTNWLSIASGNYHTLALKTDGTLWAWGQNNNGQLGLGNVTDYSSPKQVGALTNWLSIASKYNHTIALKTDGTLWVWGNNTSGQLGLGTSGVGTYKSSPTQVGVLTNWSNIAAGQQHTIALKTDGTLWTWGQNSAGQLGLGNITHYSSPKQVGALTNWLSIAAGLYYTIALKTDGTLWTWGRNDSGQLGLGNVTDYSSPKQVGALTNWLSIAGGLNHTIALKTDGTFWTWGNNLSGKLGLGTSGVGTYKSSPNQVGALTTWLSIAGGLSHTIATRS